MADEAPCVATILLNWKREEETIVAACALAGIDYPNHRLYVMDNGATAESRAALAQLVGIARLLESAENLGFAGGCNRAMAEAFAEGADYVWLLNADAEVGPGVLAALVAAAEADPRIGLVSPVLREDATALAYAAIGYDAATFAMPTTIDAADGARWQAERPGQMLLWGTALLVRRAVFERIGGLDEAFFAYVEDLDFSIRSLKAGFHNHVAFGIEVLHPSKNPLLGTAPPYYYYFRTRNDIFLLRAHCPAGLRLRMYARFLYRQMALVERLAGQRALQEAVLAGMWHGIRRVGGAYRAEYRMPAPLAAPLRWAAPVLRRMLGAL